MDDTTQYLDSLQETSNVNDYINSLKEQAMQNFEDLKEQPIEAIGSIIGIEAAQRLGGSLLDMARTQGVEWSKGFARTAMKKAGVADEDIAEVLKGNVSSVMKKKAQDLIDKAKSKVQEKVDSVKEDIQNKVDSAKQDIQDAIQDKVDNIQDTASDLIDTARNTASDLVDTAQNTAQDLANTAQNTVEDAQGALTDAVNTARASAQGVVSDTVNTAQTALSDARNIASSVSENLEGTVQSVSSNVGRLSQRVSEPQVELPDFDDLASIESPFVNTTVQNLNPLERQDYLDVLNGEVGSGMNLSEDLYNEAYGARQILLQKGVAIPKSGEVAGTLPEREFQVPEPSAGSSSNQIGRLLQKEKLKKQQQEQQQEPETPSETPQEIPETQMQPQDIQETNIDEAMRQQQETTPQDIQETNIDEAMRQQQEETSETPETPEETPEVAPETPQVAPATSEVGEATQTVEKTAGALEDAGEAAEGTGVGELIAPALILGGVLASIFGVKETPPHLTPLNPSSQFV